MTRVKPGGVSRPLSVTIPLRCHFMYFPPNCPLLDFSATDMLYICLYNMYLWAAYVKELAFLFPPNNIFQSLE